MVRRAPVRRHDSHFQYYASRRFACFSSFARTRWLSDRSAAAASTAVRAKSAKIAKQGLPLDRQSLYEMLQIPSVALFAHVPLRQLLTPPPRYSDADFEPIPLVL